ncbi:hypothetical protein YC2023_072255 [Brassica napus]
MFFSCSRSPILDRRLLLKRSDRRKPKHHTNGLALAGNSLSLSLSMISLSIFTLDWMNEIDREDPIFIENEGVRLAPRTGMTGQQMGTIGQGLHPLGRMHPFANTAWVCVGQRPKALPNPSGLSPWPCPKPQWSTTGPDLDHRTDSRTVSVPLR